MIHDVALLLIKFTVYIVGNDLWYILFVVVSCDLLLSHFQVSDQQNYHMIVSLVHVCISAKVIVWDVYKLYVTVVKMAMWPHHMSFVQTIHSVLLQTLKEYQLIQIWFVLESVQNQLKAMLLVFESCCLKSEVQNLACYKQRLTVGWKTHQKC